MGDSAYTQRVGDSLYTQRVGDELFSHTTQVITPPPGAFFLSSGPWHYIAPYMGAGDEHPPTVRMYSAPSYIPSSPSHLIKDGLSSLVQQVKGDESNGTPPPIIAPLGIVYEQTTAYILPSLDTHQNGVNPGVSGKSQNYLNLKSLTKSTDV